MKSLKLLFAAILGLLVINPVFAEGDTKLGGVRAGYHTSDIFNDGNSTGNPLNGFYLGVYKNNKIIPTLHWMVGLEYFQNGYKTDANNKWILHTASIPVNLKLKLGPVFVLGGVAANLVFSESYVRNGKDQGNVASVFDAPVFLGAGFRVLILNIEARYHWGTLDVNEFGAKNQYLQVGLGVSF